MALHGGQGELLGQRIDARRRPVGPVIADVPQMHRRNDGRERAVRLHRRVAEREAAAPPPARPLPCHFRRQRLRAAAQRPCRRMAEERDHRGDQAIEEGRGEPAIGVGPSPPFAGLRGDAEDRIGTLDAAREAERIAAERVADEQQRQTVALAACLGGGQRGAHVEHGPVAHGGGFVTHMTLARLADAAVVVAQHRVAARSQPLREGAVEVARHAGGRMHHRDRARGALRRLEPRGGERAAVVADERGVVGQHVRGGSRGCGAGRQARRGGGSSHAAKLRKSTAH